MKEIYLASGKGVALVDDKNYELLSQHSWCDNGCGYAITSIDGKGVRMHRLITDAQPGEEVDHINRDRLDNRETNLRIVTRSQNCRNKSSRGGTSDYVGVSWRADREVWEAKIRVSGRKKFLGYFRSEQGAAHAYDRAVVEYGLEAFAPLNFPVEVSRG
jgi:hypothetical protein